VRAGDGRGGRRRARTSPRLRRDAAAQTSLNGALLAAPDGAELQSTRGRAGAVSPLRAARRAEGDPAALPFQLPTRSRRGLRADSSSSSSRGSRGSAEARAARGAHPPVGLVARATDAGSGSLLDNLRKVLLAVVEDGKSPARGARVFRRATTSAARCSRAARRSATRSCEPGSSFRWVKDEKEKRFAAVGPVPPGPRHETGLKTSASTAPRSHLEGRRGTYSSTRRPLASSSRTAARW